MKLSKKNITLLGLMYKHGIITAEEKVALRNGPNSLVQFMYDAVIDKKKLLVYERFIDSVNRGNT